MKFFHRHLHWVSTLFCILAFHLNAAYSGWITLRQDDWWLDLIGSVPAKNPDETLSDEILESWNMDSHFSQGSD